jgi:hypothetical protein
MITIRRAVIFIAQILALLFIAAATVVGALVGDSLSSTVLTIENAIPALTVVQGISLVGAAGGFFISTMLAALFYLIVDIANNTRNPFNV